jgi:hypothetical protein
MLSKLVSIEFLMLYIFGDLLVKIGCTQSSIFEKYRFLQVARTFLEVLASCIFLLPSCILGKYVWYKIGSSDIALSNENKAGSIRRRQHDSTVLEVCAKTYASYVKDEPIDSAFCGTRIIPYSLWV